MKHVELVQEIRVISEHFSYRNWIWIAKDFIGKIPVFVAEHPWKYARLFPSYEHFWSYFCVTETIFGSHLYSKRPTPFKPQRDPIPA